MWHVIAGGGAEHSQRAQQNGSARGAVNIVIAVDQDWLVTFDGSLQTRDRRGHAQHAKRIVKVIQRRIQEPAGGGFVRITTRNEQIGDDS